MNRRLVLLGIGLVVMTVVAAALTAVPREPTWTSSSPEAVLALEAALEANSKLYKNEARQHLERALELDPDQRNAAASLVDTLRRLGRAGEAEAKRRAFRARFPDHPFFRD